jgi:hypothetical protein
MRCVWAVAACLAGLAALPNAGFAGEGLQAKTPEKSTALIRLNGVGSGIGYVPASLGVLLGDGTVRPLFVEDGQVDFGAPQPMRGGQQVRPYNILPDGEITHGTNDIARAWLTDPTQRYAHGVLGDAIEAGGLVLEGRAGRQFHYLLDSGTVFEDRRVRLVDLDGNGRDEAVVIQSYLDEGAALSVFALGADGVDVVSEVPAIGRLNRWLNPVGAADFDGDGVIELAYVETPHIGGKLRLYEFRDGRLVFDVAASGFSNHAIGSREQDQSAVVDWNGDGIIDIALPDARRRALRVVTFANGQFRELAHIAHTHKIVSAVRAGVMGADEDVFIVHILADGTLHAVPVPGGV